MKITLLEPLGIPAQVLEQYKARLEAKGHSFTAYGDKTTDPAELILRTGDSDIAIIANNPYPAQVVEAAPNLKMLDVAFTGIDHVALDACKAKNVMICNAAGYSTQCVAELAIALTIACLRKMPACERATRTGGVGGPLLLFILISVALSFWIALLARRSDAGELAGIESREGFLVLTSWLLLALSLIILLATKRPLFTAFRKHTVMRHARDLGRARCHGCAQSP